MHKVVVVSPAPPSSHFTLTDVDVSASTCSNVSTNSSEQQAKEDDARMATIMSSNPDERRHTRKKSIDPDYLSLPFYQAHSWLFRFLSVCGLYHVRSSDGKLTGQQVYC